MAIVGVLAGSISDREFIYAAVDVLNELEIPCEVKILSAHRTPKQVSDYALAAEDQGIEVIIAMAGGAAHLPGVIAAHTILPVLGVPIPSALNGLDSLLSMSQMPSGVPVGVLGVGKSGAINAAILAAEILCLKHSEIRTQLIRWRQKRQEEVLKQKFEV
jgi:5-(carboxyamino)imidazole ribonucleotide mutase